MITKIVRFLTDDVFWNFGQRLLQVLDEVIRILNTNAIKREDSNFNWISSKELNFMMQLLNIKQYLILTSPSVIPPLNLSSDVINMGPCVIVAGCSMRLSTPPNETAS